MTDTRANIVRPAIEEAVAAMTAALDQRLRYRGHVRMVTWLQIAVSRDRLVAALDYVKREDTAA